MLRILLIPLVLAVSVTEVPNPRANHDGWVTDMAGQLDSDTEAKLEATLQKIHTDLGVEVALVTVQSVPGVPKVFATELFNLWGIGNSQRNDGLLILLAMDSRRLEMETGYGLEGRLPDAWIVGMQRRHMVPHFKRGNFGTGLVVGVERIDQRLRSGSTAGTGGNTSADGGEKPYVYQGSDGHVLDFLVYGLYALCFLVALALVLFLHWKIRRRYTLCSACGEDRLLLPEDEEDEHLSSGQQTEEALRSITYDVWACPACSDLAIDSKKRWQLTYSDCVKCDRRTMTTKTKTLRAATTSLSGNAQITEDCKHCSHSRSYQRTIPRIVVSSSSGGSGSSWSSSSGGSSFGGGSSGGGGGGSSW